MNAKSPITEQHIQFYRENGFVQVEHILSPEEVKELARYMEEAMQTEGTLSPNMDTKGGLYYRVLNQKVNTWRDHAGMGKFSFHPRLARAALDLTGANEMRVFHDHALWKMPRDSKPTPWHQDTPYWPVNESEAGMMSAWIALDDVNEDNGCMAFVPKSHRLGKLTEISLTEPQNLFDYVEGDQLEDKRPVVVPLRAGSCTFHNGLTFHYAHANQTDKPRRAFAIIYMPDRITYNGQPHIVTDELHLPINQPLVGPLFPVVAQV